MKKFITDLGLVAGPVAILLAAILAGIGIASALAGNRSAPRPELAYGIPTIGYVERHGFIAAPAGHYTAWTIEHLTSASFVQKADRSDFTFYADDDVPAEFRATLRDYQGSDFDRGHIAPAGDMVADALAMRDAYRLSNMMPQTKELNRGPWKALESHVRGLASQAGVEVWCVTGPAWIADETGTVKFEAVGSHAIWAPTHCWKAVLVRHQVARGHGQGPSEKTELAAWLLPNTKKPPDFEKCAVSIDEIEAAAGLDLFSGLEDDMEDRLEAAK